MKLESEKAGVILGFIGVSWVYRGTLGSVICVFQRVPFHQLGECEGCKAWVKGIGLGETINRRRR